jgi:hypothetical protein
MATACSPSAPWPKAHRSDRFQAGFMTGTFHRGSQWAALAEPARSHVPAFQPVAIDGRSVGIQFSAATMRVLHERRPTAQHGRGVRRRADGDDGRAARSGGGRGT